MNVYNAMYMCTCEVHIALKCGLTIIAKDTS